MKKRLLFFIVALAWSSAYSFSANAEAFLVEGEAEYDSSLRVRRIHDPSIFGLGPHAALPATRPYFGISLMMDDVFPEVSNPDPTLTLGVFGEPISSADEIQFNPANLNNDPYDWSTLYDFDLSFDSDDFNNLTTRYNLDTDNMFDRFSIQDNFADSFYRCVADHGASCQEDHSDQVADHAYFRREILEANAGDVSDCMRAQKSQCSQNAFAENVAVEFEALDDRNKYLLDRFLEDFQFTFQDSIVVNIPLQNRGELEAAFANVDPTAGGVCRNPDGQPNSTGLFRDHVAAADLLVYGQDSSPNSKARCTSILEGASQNIERMFQADIQGPQQEGEQPHLALNVIPNGFCECVASNLESDNSEYSGLMCEEVQGATQEYLGRELGDIIQDGLAARNKGFFSILDNPSGYNNASNQDRLKRCMPGYAKEGVLETSKCSLENQQKIGRMMSELLNEQIVAKARATAAMNNEVFDEEAFREQFRGGGHSRGGGRAAEGRGDRRPASRHEDEHGGMDFLRYRDIMDRKFMLQNLAAVAPELLPEEFRDFNSLNPRQRRRLMKNFDVEEHFYNNLNSSSAQDLFRFTADDAALLKDVERAAADYDPARFNQFFNNMNADQKKIFRKLHALRFVKDPELALRSDAIDLNNPTSAFELGMFYVRQAGDLRAVKRDVLEQPGADLTADFLNEAMRSANIGEFDSINDECEEIFKKVENVCKVLEEPNEAFVSPDLAKLAKNDPEAAEAEIELSSVLRDSEGEYKYEQLLCYSKYADAGDSKKGLFLAGNASECPYDADSLFTTENLLTPFSDSLRGFEPLDNVPDHVMQAVNDQYRECMSQLDPRDQMGNVACDYARRTNLMREMANQIEQDCLLRYQDDPEYVASGGCRAEREAYAARLENRDNEEGSHLTSEGHGYDPAMYIANDFLESATGVTVSTNDGGASLTAAVSTITQSGGVANVIRYPSSMDTVNYLGSFGGGSGGSGSGLGTQAPTGTTDVIDLSADGANGSGGGGALGDATDPESRERNSRVHDKMNSVAAEINEAVTRPGSPLSDFQNRLNARGANVTPEVVRSEAERALSNSNNRIDSVENMVDAARANGANNNDPRVQALLQELEELRGQQNSLRELLASEKEQRILAETKREEAEAPAIASGAPARAAARAPAATNGFAAAGSSAGGGVTNVAAINNNAAGPGPAVAAPAGGGGYAGSNYGPDTSALTLSQTSVPFETRTFNAGGANFEYLSSLTLTNDGLRTFLASRPDRSAIIETAEGFEKRFIAENGDLVAQCVRVNEATQELETCGDPQVIVAANAGAAPARAVANGEGDVRDQVEPVDGQTEDRRTFFKATLDGFFGTQDKP